MSDQQFFLIFFGIFLIMSSLVALALVIIYHGITYLLFRRPRKEAPDPKPSLLPESNLMWIALRWFRQIWKHLTGTSSRRK